MSDELIIKESNLNLAKIGSLFKSAFIDSELDPEVELIVIKDYPEILIDLDKDRSCIRFTSRFRIKCGFDELTILKAINNANLGKIMIRYFLDNTDPKNPSFIADYYSHSYCCLWYNYFKFKSP